MTKISQISKLYDTYLKKYNDEWSYADEVIYELCKKHPDHKDKNSINSKLWIIGYTFETKIERNLPDGVGHPYEYISNHLFKNKENLDSGLKLLSKKSSTSQLSIQEIKDNIIVHGSLVNLLSQITKINDLSKRNERPSVFVSKYLHFHCANMPIMDKNTEEGLSKIGYNFSDLKTTYFEQPKDVDKRYYQYYLTFYQLFNDILDSGKTVSVRNLEYCLFYIGQRKIKI